MCRAEARKVGPRCADQTLGRPRLRKCRGGMCTPQNCGSAGPGHRGQSRQAPGSVRHILLFLPSAHRELGRQCREVGAQSSVVEATQAGITAAWGPSSWRGPSDIPGLQTAPEGSVADSLHACPSVSKDFKEAPPRLSPEMGDDWDRSPVPLSHGCIRSCGVCERELRAP